MYNGKKTAVLIAAAGSGSRVGAPIPKQFLRIGAVTMLERSVQTFEDCEMIDEIYVIAPSAETEQATALLSNISKLKPIVPGGETRQESVRNGLAAIQKAHEQRPDDTVHASCLVLIHDAARPYVDADVIARVIRAADETGAAIPCVPVQDTIYRAAPPDPTRGEVCGESCDEVCGEACGEFLESVQDRALLRRVQTPQGFDLDLIFSAHEQAHRDAFVGTDDGMLVKRLGHAVALVAGSYENIKITTPEDLPKERADASVRVQGEPPGEDFRVGIGFDVHAFAHDRKLILGGVEIPYDKGLLGHSDADVLTHAVMDAMLGALSLGDIGKHFPDTDERYRDISSMELLRRVKAIVAAHGWVVTGADTVIVAEKPKLAGYTAAIGSSLAAALDLTADLIGVKATTTEGLGFTGREEGIGAQAVVHLAKIREEKRR